jgi:hypothetical protein
MCPSKPKGRRRLPTFEGVYGRMIALGETRAKGIKEMRAHLAEASELSKAGKKREGLAALRKAEALAKKLGIYRSK